MAFRSKFICGLLSSIFSNSDFFDPILGEKVEEEHTYKFQAFKAIEFEDVAIQKNRLAKLKPTL